MIGELPAGPGPRSQQIPPQAAVLEPKLSQYSELFEGTMKDRDLLTKEDSGNSEARNRSSTMEKTGCF